VLSMTDAMVCAMGLPGALAVALVEIKTGKAITGDGIENVNIDQVTPGFTEFLLYHINTLTDGDVDNGVQDVVITTEGRMHIMRPLSGDATGLYLYAALDRSRASMPLARRCPADIGSRLQI
jgi:hypothetical protein